MSDRLFGSLTINQMLFVSHLALVLSIIFGMSYTRYQSDWQTKVEYLADTSASHLAAYNTFYSGSVAGRNYASLLMQSTLDNLKAIPNLKYVEVSGTSDYLKREVKVRYSIDKSKGWRLDVTKQEVDQLVRQLSHFENSLAATPATDVVHIKKLNHLISKLHVDIAALRESLELAPLPIPTMPEREANSPYYLDEYAVLLHVQMPLRNENGGYLKAVVDATELRQIKQDLLSTVLLEALVALLVSFVLIYLVTMWLVSPVKALAALMKKDIEKIDQSRIPEINRADEIGDLARSCSSFITRIKNQLRILHNQTETDPLTGIGSRLKYQKHAAENIHQALSNGELVYFLMCDIDNFKRFNDAYGHTEGDNALTEVANAMNDLLDPHELGCRLGGEEFVFILSSHDVARLQDKVESFRTAVEKLNIEHTDNAPHQVVTVSIGAVPVSSSLSEVSKEQASQSIKKAFVTADKQLYQAKEQGRNVVKYSPALYID